MQVAAAYYIRISGGNIWGIRSDFRAMAVGWSYGLNQSFTGIATSPFIFRRVCAPKFVISCAPL